ncbi:hypothetical protein [Bradyrhizobium sp. BWA-3-5]|uniref:hypothetical protein n=1 Tax=Bradyrhizobium sp. BWA-3-5 TaxID=3080013 RepID=UPI00293E7294|nr:hypothetical protein [Bradyrhizobium sp. BWA-3-5]WOH65392.1 hypothetical protein RX331_33415 [Bradyrhizobium sp. BWA-3-5]
MSWRGWLSGQTPSAPGTPGTLLAGIKQRGRQYLDDADNGKWVFPACKRTTADAGADRATVCDHTRLEAFRYLLMVPRGEFKLLAEPDSQGAAIEAYLRQRPHEDIVIEFTGNTMNDLATAVIAGFNWLNHCAGLARADRRPFSGTLNHFRRVALSAQKWWEMEGAKARSAQMLQAGQEPPLLLNLVWADYGRLAAEIAAGRRG